jgi:DNA mismatch endonuclease (patch repair protein)
MDTFSKQQRSKCMSKIKSKNTMPEKIVQKTLSNLKIRYRLHSVKLPGKPDIVIGKNKIVIFINGCFWHQHKNCKRSSSPKSNTDYWLSKLKRNVEKQKQDISELKKLGWKVIIIWECETINQESLNKTLSKLASN